MSTSNRSGADALLLVALRMTLGEWGWPVTEEGDGLFFVHVGNGKPFLLSVEVGGDEVDAHLDRGAGRSVREDSFSKRGWRPKVAGWAVAKLRDLGIEPVEVGGGA